LPGGRGLNIAYEAVDRHVSGAKGARVAFRWIARSSKTRDITYAELSALTNRFANALDGLGVRRGDVVVALTERIPQLYIAALGSLKKGAVFSPFFSAFGPEPIKARMNIERARVLVTTETLYGRKVEPHRSAMPALEHVLLVGEPGTGVHMPATRDFQTLLDQSAAAFTIPPTDPSDPALLHFTSGTTGQPKGAIHVHEAVVAHHITGRFALDLHPEDIFWCTADPGWVTGTSYGIVAPLTNGITSIIDEGDFDAERWYRIVRDERVSVWYTAPTAIRMMMKHGTALARGQHLDSLRFLVSVGEPLNPEAVLWGGGSMHVFDAAKRFYGGNAIVGGGLPIAVGLVNRHLHPLLRDGRKRSSLTAQCISSDLPRRLPEYAQRRAARIAVPRDEQMCAEKLACFRRGA